MKLIEAREEDSERLKEFAQQIAIPGRVCLSTKRHTDFFDIYKVQSDNFQTYFLEDSRGKIQACATLVFRKGYINREVVNIGLCHDLWMTSDRKALIEWPKHFLRAIQEQMQANDCRHLFSAVSARERLAFNSFIRPKAIRGAMPRYYPLKRFQVIAIHGRLPFFYKPLDTVLVENANEQMAEEISDYLNKKSRERLLGPVYKKTSFYQSIQKWPGLQFSDFIVLRNHKREIIGCCAPWNSGHIESSFAKQYGAIAKTFRKFLSFTSFTGQTRPLARTLHPLNFTFLTHFFADNSDLYNSLINSAWQQTDDKQTLLYPHFEGDYDTLPHPTFVYSKTPFALYTILSPEEKLPENFRSRLQSPPPYFELGL